MSQRQTVDDLFIHMLSASFLDPRYPVRLAQLVRDARGLDVAISMS